MARYAFIFDELQKPAWLADATNDAKKAGM